MSPATKQSDRSRTSAASQRQAILDRLRRGPATTVELAQIALKYTSRVSELRKAGHAITAALIEGGVYQYRLAEPGGIAPRNATSGCRHHDPTSFVRRGDAAYCPCCNRWMGNYRKA